jgi:competence protein ComEC
MIRKNILLFALTSFSLGILTRHYLFLGQAISSFALFALSLFSFFLFLRSKKYFFIIFTLFLLGAWRYDIFLKQKEARGINNYYNKEITVLGKVSGYPELKNYGQKIEVEVRCLFWGDNYLEVGGRSLIIVSHYPVYNYGDFLKIHGTFKEPGFIDEFDYGLYLKGRGISSTSYYPTTIKDVDADLIESCFNYSFFSSYKKRVSDIRANIGRQIDFNLSPAKSSILKAIMIGDKSSISSNIRESFSRAGISHIIAISGMHVSLLTSIVISFLIIIGFSRKKSFYFSIAFLFFYLFLVGAPASACRAAIMGSFYSLSVCIGRNNDTSRSLFLTAFVLLFINPLLILTDIGFKLSFLAVLSIVYLHPLIKHYLDIFLNKKSSSFIDSVLDILSISISVQVLILPILLSSFKEASLFSPLSNLLVVWLVPVLMTLSLIAILSSFIIPAIGSFVYFFISLILDYIILAAHLVSNLSWSFLSIHKWSLLNSFIYYFIVFIVFYKIKKQRYIL